jgi:nucleotide-binding universal stress UspA family protein
MLGESAALKASILNLSVILPVTDCHCVSVKLKSGGKMFRKITVAFDESEEAGRALQAAVELAKSLDASLNVISVIEPPPIYFSFSTLVAPYIRWTDEMETRYTNVQSKARQLAENAGLAIDATISNGDEIGSIIAAAIHNECDLLVIGMPKHTWMIGHTAHNLAESVP